MYPIDEPEDEVLTSKVAIEGTKEEIVEGISEGDLDLEDADDEFKKDRDIVLAAVKQDGSALQYADDSLKEDEDIKKLLED